MVSSLGSTGSTSTSTGRPPAGTSCATFRRVLVAWDGSPDAVAALRAAAGIAGGPGHVVALTVLPEPPHPEAEQDQPGGERTGGQRLAEIFEHTRAAIATASPVRLSLHTVQGRAVARSLCDYAAEHGFELLVLGRHGDGGVLHPRLGHVAEAAARTGKIPVLLLSAE